MFSQTAEYALRAVTYLAGEDGPRTTEQIALATRVPSAYLSKIMQALSKAGLVSSQRGLRGGSMLLHDPDDISILDVVNAVDPLKRIRTCPLGLEEHGTKLCKLHRQMDDAMVIVETNLASVRISELTSERKSSKSCRFPRAVASEQ